MYYQIGQSVAVRCIESWKEYDGDYQILAYTKIDDINLMGISILDLFEYRKEEKLYYQLYEEDRMFYIMKKIERLNFEYVDTNQEIDTATEYIYLCDDLIDYNRTEVLTKRSQLNATIYVGTFFSEKLTDDTITITGYHKDIKRDLEKDLNVLLDNYSDSFIISFDDNTTILQPLSYAMSEDESFLDKREQAIKDALEKELEAKEKQEYLINKENQLLEKERDLNRIKDALVKDQRETQEQLEIIEKEKQSLLASQNAIDKYEAYLAQKEAKLNKRAERITERENELGISNSNL